MVILDELLIDVLTTADESCPGLCVRSCCFMLSLRVKALLHVGHRIFFSPVCFFPCRAAWPEVVNLSGH